jgi:hypothetical protein
MKKRKKKAPIEVPIEEAPEEKKEQYIPYFSKYLPDGSLNPNYEAEIVYQGSQDTSEKLGLNLGLNAFFLYPLIFIIILLIILVIYCMYEIYQYCQIQPHIIVSN